MAESIKDSIKEKKQQAEAKRVAKDPVLLQQAVQEAAEKEVLRDVKQIRTTFTADEERDIELRAREYRLKGKSDEEAQKLAEEEVTKDNKVSEDAYQDFVAKIKLYDVLDNIIRRILEGYRREYNVARPQEDISFRLHIRKNKNKGGVIFSVSLVLEMRRNNKYKQLLEKKVSFQHVKEIRAESYWKYALYEAMLQSLVFSGLTQFVIKDDIDNGKLQ